MQLTQALDILKQIRGYETECAELLFHNGGAENIKQAQKMICYELETLLDDDMVEDGD